MPATQVILSFASPDPVQFWSVHDQIAVVLHAERTNIGALCVRVPNGVAVGVVQDHVTVGLQ